ncbi:unnamed protein product [Lathyrus oleraceus]
MHPNKALGTDGLPALFFQMYWAIIGKDVTKLALDILNNHHNPVDINSTFITLVHKHKNPITLKDFRPISLFNMAMKDVTKAILNQLKLILPDIISED